MKKPRPGKQRRSWASKPPWFTMQNGSLWRGVGTILLEETFDWIAWDNDGNVWRLWRGFHSVRVTMRMGISKAPVKQAHGRLAVDGALPGILMLSQSKLKGDSYRQEFAEDVAEDMASVVNLGVTVTLQEFVRGRRNHIRRLREDQGMDTARTRLDRVQVQCARSWPGADRGTPRQKSRYRTGCH